MSEISGEELKSVDQTSVDQTSHLIKEKIVIEKEKSVLENAQEISQSIDIPLSQEKSAEMVDTSTDKKFAKTHQAVDQATENAQGKNKSIRSPKDEDVDGGKHCNTSLVVEEITAPTDICNTKLSLEEKYVGAVKIEANPIKETSQGETSEHVTYTENGTAVYTDPKSNYQYEWCIKENKWIPRDAAASIDGLENEHYKWCSETQKWIPKQTQITETEHYKWDAEKKEWIAKVKDISKIEERNSGDVVYDMDKDGQRTYTDKDGTVFFWDVDKNAWFPKIDEDFMARYQMSYGFIDNTSESEREKEKRDFEAAVQKKEELAKMVEEAKVSAEASKELTKQGVKRKQLQEPPKWFEVDPSHNTKVYVSNLPLDITLDEFADFMGKCGMIMRDPQTQKYKLKLYTESDGQIKGDGLCDYIKVESVDLALKILDEYDLRGHKVRVQRAQFQMRGEYNPALKPKRKKKDKEKLAKIKEKLFDWRPEKMRGERSKNEKTVIIKNLFHTDLFEKEVQLILDYQNDLREECSKCGTVRKVIIYDRHSEGVAQVNMSTPEEADLVIQMMHGRFFGKRKLTAEHWDGKTKYKIEETEEEIQKRLNKWDQYLETEENKNKEGENAAALTNIENSKELMGKTIENPSVI